MPGASGGSAAAGGGQQNDAPAGPMEQFSQVAMRLLLLFILYNIFQGFKNPNSVLVPGVNTPAADGVASTGSGASIPPGIQTTKALKNSWRNDLEFDMSVWISEDEYYLRNVLQENRATPDWEEKRIKYNFDEENSRSFATNITLPESFRDGNGSMWLHVALEPCAEDEDGIVAPIFLQYNLVEWRQKEEKRELHSLVQGREQTEEKPEIARPDPEQDEDAAEDQKYIRYWKPELYLQLLVDQHLLGTGKIPPNVEELYGKNYESGVYTPPMLFNEFWLLKECHIDSNSTVHEVPLTLHFANIGIYKLTVFHQLEQTWESNPLMAMQGHQIEDLKRTLLDTSPYLLGLTAFVSLAHSVLELLAFKNDITHWATVKSMEGVSVRTMFWKVGMDLITCLYLLDNNASWMIVIGACLGVLIEVWKLGKAVNFKSFGKKKLYGFIPWFEFEDKASYTESKTKEYDDHAMKYLGYVVYPCVILYAIYSLVYETHRSWYSWLVSSLAGAVYAFGFVMMFPQIFINYKLKSVAHLPMKAFMYKALNTVIDDLFSFIIKMPFMHRMACFRDDIVFAIFLYQKWIYPVDKTRVNEFGQVFEEPALKKKKKSKSKTSKTKSSSSSSATSSKVSAEPKKIELKKNE